MEWAEVGKTAIFFHNGGASETCIGSYWYQCYPNGEWWGLSHGEPFLLRSFMATSTNSPPRSPTSSLEKKWSCRAWWMATRMICICAALDPASQGELEDSGLQSQARFRRLGRRGLSPSRRYAWLHALFGGDGVDPDAQSISAISLNADGKTDLCLAGGGRGRAAKRRRMLSEISLPGSTGAGPLSGPITMATACPICCWRLPRGRSCTRILARVSSAMIRTCCRVSRVTT